MLILELLQVLARIRLLKYQIQPNCRGHAVENGACVKVTVQLSFCGIKDETGSKSSVCLFLISHTQSCIHANPSLLQAVCKVLLLQMAKHWNMPKSHGKEGWSVKIDTPQGLNGKTRTARDRQGQGRTRKDRKGQGCLWRNNEENGMEGREAIKLGQACATPQQAVLTCSPGFGRCWGGHFLGLFGGRRANRLGDYLNRGAGWHAAQKS